MINYSKETQEALWGEAALSRSLEQIQQTFEAGNCSSLWEAIEVCARHDLKLPDWVRNGILTGSQKLRSGEVRNFDELFGVELESKATRRRDTRLEQYKDAVLHELAKHRLEIETIKRDGSVKTGRAFGVEEAYVPVAEKLGISRRDVEAIYKKYGAFLANLPRGNPEGNAYFIIGSEGAYGISPEAKKEKAGSDR